MKGNPDLERVREFQMKALLDIVEFQCDELRKQFPDTAVCGVACGDFNATPNSRPYQVAMKHNLKVISAYAAFCGQEPPVTCLTDQIKVCAPLAAD